MTQTKAQKSGSWTPQIQKKAPSLAPPPIVVQRDAIAAPTSEAPLSEYTPLEPNALQNHPLMGNISDLPPIQTKLTIGAPGDRYEQEADTIARKVVSQINSPTAQAKPATKVLQRQPVGRDITVSPFAGMVQGKEAIAGGPASQDLESSINRAKGGGQPLDAGLQQSMGQAMGADFSGVKVHTDANSHQLNQSIQAKAFTTGQDVFFKQGEYNPDSKDGQELIAHELTHVVQQNGSISNTNNSTIQLTRERSNAITKPVTRERSNAMTEQDLASEQLDYLQTIRTRSGRNIDNILKFNFAGTGEKAWKTHKEKYAKPGKQQMSKTDHITRGKKYSKQKRSLEQDKTVFEYAGPLAKLGRDSGENSTDNNLLDAQLTFNSFMEKFIDFMSGAGISRPECPKVQVNIKGFSRGAATASVFANWIKSKSGYKDLVNINLVLIDPVHGTDFLGVGAGLMPGEQDVDGIYDRENAPDITGTTLLLPVQSGHTSLGSAFTPQKIKGAQRIIIAYGKGVKHSFGLGESEKSTLKYENQPLKGMKLSTLPKGLFAVDAADMNIRKVRDMKQWIEEYEKKILKDANKKESRDKFVREAIQEFFI